MIRIRVRVMIRIRVRVMIRIRVSFLFRPIPESIPECAERQNTFWLRFEAWF